MKVIPVSTFSPEGSIASAPKGSCVRLLEEPLPPTEVVFDVYLSSTSILPLYLLNFRLANTISSDKKC